MTASQKLQMKMSELRQKVNSLPKRGKAGATMTPD